MGAEQGKQIIYEVPEEELKNLFQDQINQKKDMIFSPTELIQIYKDLKEMKIYLTSFISAGNQGAVFEALHEAKVLAVKCIKCVGQKDKEKINEEKKIIQELKDTPYAFQCIKEFYSSDSSVYFQISKKYQCSLQGIMEDLFSKKKTMSLNQIIGFALQMSQVFEKIQTKKMLHSDVKPDNILYDSQEKSFNLCDFGVSKFFQDEKTKTEILKGFTRKYSAPELLFGNPNNDLFSIKFDIYGLGIILLELTLGRFLEIKECTSIAQGQFDQYINDKKIYSELNQIIIKMIQTQYKDRIDSFELTELLNSLKVQLENEFISVVYGKLDSFDQNQMISKFRQSFLQFNFQYKPKESRLDSYQFQFKKGDKLNKIKEIMSKRIVRHLELNFQYNELGADGARNIGISLEKCLNITSLDLNLEENNLGADGARNIGISLEKCLNITSLDLNLGNQFQYFKKVQQIRQINWRRDKRIIKKKAKQNLILQILFLNENLLNYKNKIKQKK